MYYRIRWKDLLIVNCEDKICKKTNVKFDDAVRVVELFRKNGNLDLIRDGDFIKGGFRNGKVFGERINVLPSGARLNKSFPLFSPTLKIHDERSHGHWDVIFENMTGSLTYVYDLEKIKLSKDKKFDLAGEFERCLPRLRRNLMRNLGESDLVLAMLVLLKTRMRVGCEIYYRRNRHKGLTTLKKKDFKIKGNLVMISFIGKDGVPQEIKVRFGKRILDELKRVLKKRRMNDFVFLNSKSSILKDTDFEKGFLRFCGIGFYPHIVRSHFATQEVEKFLKRDRKGARKFCLGLASRLGHKKLVNGEWKNSYTVTLNHYVRPDLVERLEKLV